MPPTLFLNGAPKTAALNQLLPQGVDHFVELRSCRMLRAGEGRPATAAVVSWKSSPRLMAAKHTIIVAVSVDEAPSGCLKSVTVHGC